jgi:hypothetical protein
MAKYEGLISLDNVISNPHCGASTDEIQNETCVQAVDQLVQSPLPPQTSSSKSPFPSLRCVSAAAAAAAPDEDFFFSFLFPFVLRVGGLIKADYLDGKPARNRVI